MNWNFLPLATLLLVCLMGAAEVTAQNKPASEVVAKGQTIYMKRCSFCHGIEGKGDGPVADYLNPRPRDFTSGAYKIRTTKSGEAPLDEDLLRTLKRGIPGTGMQGFDGVLTEEEQRQLLAFIKSLPPGRFDAAPEKAEIGSEKKGSAEMGKEVYQKAKCWECHGQKGRGDGSKAAQLTDDWGFPILPADLTKGWRYKGGTTLKDIFARFSTGMDGTPMPSYADALSEEERWHLSAYVKSLIEGEKIGTEVVIRSKRIDRDLPLDPNDPIWQRAEPIDVPMSGQVIVSPRWENATVDEISVRSLYNDKAIAFLLEWNDRFKDTEHKEEALPPVKDTYAKVLRDKMWMLRDAVAIQFPTGVGEGQARPYFFYAQPERPVVLW
ncbi:MAG: c-type cytochrome, partial [Deltaproteobacteria bacterium]|nr:c-type cytochrome [Deltaproteobacteria bacterium]